MGSFEGADDSVRKLTRRPEQDGQGAEEKRHRLQAVVQNHPPHAALEIHIFFRTSK